MPSLHHWGATAQQTRMPLTPPEHSYLTPMSATSDQSFYAAQNYMSRPHSGRDFDRYQVPAYPAQQVMSAKASSRVNQMQLLQDYYSLPGYAPNPGYSYVGAPILPPLRIQGSVDPYATSYTHTHPEPKPKEEKATGGVAAHLDYDMELMASFVAEMAQELVLPRAQPAAQFRKYVAQILSSTRLPSSTIMLGLFYLASRMKILERRGEVVQSSGAVYRLLTICLLLGSKFLDDNTFQNRSWAEVSSISVHELNTMELDWLKDFDWTIHSIMYQEHEGFFKWIDHWHAYEAKAHHATKQEMQKLTPIETNLHRSHSITQQPLLSPDGPIPPQYQQSAQFDTQWARPLMSEYSPPSAPHSGPATPDYYPGNWTFAQPPPAYGRSSWASGSSAYASQRSQPPSYHHTPLYPSQTYTQSMWTGHGSGCGCSLCSKHPDYYFTNGGYSLQPVVG